MYDLSSNSCHGRDLDPCYLVDYFQGTEAPRGVARHHDRRCWKLALGGDMVSCLHTSISATSRVPQP